MRRRGSGWGIVFICLIVAGVALLISGLINAKLTPLLAQIGQAQVAYAAKDAMNQAVSQLADEGGLNYDAIVSFEKDDSGAITAVKTDVAQINRLKTMATEAVLEKIGCISVDEISIPVGNLLALDFLSGMGPEIPVKIIGVKTAAVDFANDFESAGINQTIHRIYLNCDVEITVLIGGKTGTVQTQSMFCVAETVIVGAVPESYTYFSETDSAQDAMDKYFNFG